MKVVNTKNDSALINQNYINYINCPGLAQSDIDNLILISLSRNNQSSGEMEAQDLCYCLTGKLTNYFYVGPLAKNLRSQFKCCSRSRGLSDPITDLDICVEKNYRLKLFIYLRENV